jgi:peptidoglycan/xylan/chitin deacetylase (PgdA/CDA1 family)
MDSVNTMKLPTPRIVIAIAISLIGFSAVSALLLARLPAGSRPDVLRSSKRAINVLLGMPPTPTPTPTETPTPTPTPIPTPTPTPRPLTLAEMNARYGPCAYVPTLMYHHIQDMNEAKTRGNQSLTVDTGTFRAQMQYLRDRGYTTIKPIDLINFFDAGGTLPGKPVLLTFDDGYDDFGNVAAPILREYGYYATAFIPAGLVDNTGYMNWGKIMEIAGWGTISLSNHTWSHRNVAAGRDTVEREITTADKQLSDRGLNQAKVFAYPYGLSSPTGIAVLGEDNYRLAFTTTPGAILCKEMRLTLPRLRIGNTALSSYGL